MLSLDQLKKTHSTYGGNARTWDYLSRSYAGGNQYREAGYLRKYLGEDQSPGNQYAQRLISTALNNQVQNVVSIYRSYIFKAEPQRKLGASADMYGVEEFLDDCDLDGSDMDDFMRAVGDTLSVYGNCWIACDRPSYQAQTLAEEQALGIRPYVTLYTPMQVLDWCFERAPNGSMELTMVKIREASMDDYDVIRVWTPDVIQEYKLKRQMRPSFVSTGNGINNQPVQEELFLEYEKIIEAIEYPNALGYVPVICAYNQRKVKPGVGISDVTDVADSQRAIYNLVSELEQNIRVSSHPSLVKPGDVDAAAGAGAIINMPDNMDPGLKPYLLQPTTATVDSILNGIKYHIDAIDSMTNLGSVRGTKANLSGVALEAEFLLLNSRLADKAANLEKIEYKIWDIWFDWQDMDFPDDFEIEYEDSFSIRDSQRDMTMIQSALTAVDNPLFQLEAKKQLVQLTITDDIEIEMILADMDQAYDQAQLDQNPADPATTVDPSQPQDSQMTDAQPQSAQSTDTTTQGDSCPVATQDVSLNLKNRGIAIKQANYGPMNPSLPNKTFWIQKANIFGSTPAEAKKSLCGNCAAFDQTKATLACIDQGISANGGGNTAWDTIAQADLGYCTVWDFKCAATRSCDAWITGGPIKD